MLAYYWELISIKLIFHLNTHILGNKIKTTFIILCWHVLSLCSTTTDLHPRLIKLPFLWVPFLSVIVFQRLSFKLWLWSQDWALWRRPGHGVPEAQSLGTVALPRPRGTGSTEHTHRCSTTSCRERYSHLHLAGCYIQCLWHHLMRHRAL